jgi:hypothetical protein
VISVSNHSRTFTPPFARLLVMHQLGRDYVVWDTRGQIEMLKPGRGVLTAQFHVPSEQAEAIRDTRRSHGRAGASRA